MAAGGRAGSAGGAGKQLRLSHPSPARPDLWGRVPARRPYSVPAGAGLVSLLSPGMERMHFGCCCWWDGPGAVSEVLLLGHPTSFGELLGCPVLPGPRLCHLVGLGWLLALAGSGDAPGLQPWPRGCTMAFCLRGCPGNIPPSQFPSNMKPPRGCLPGAQSLGLRRGAALAPFPAPPTCAPSVPGLSWVGGRCQPSPGVPGGGKEVAGNQGNTRNGACAVPSVQGCG